MKILHVISNLSSSSGGPVNVVLGLTRALFKKGLDVSIYTTNYYDKSMLDVSAGRELIKDGVKIHYFKTSFPHFVRYSPSFASALRNSIDQFDIIHIHGLWHFPVSLAATYAYYHNIPYIIRPCGHLNPYCIRNKSWRKKIYAALWERRNLNRARVIHCLNQEEEFAVRKFGVKSPSIVIPNGLDISQYERLPSRNSFRERHPQISGKQMVLFLGRIDRIKGLDLLIAAFADVVQKVSDSHLVIAGPDNHGYTREVQRMVAKAGLGGYVTFTGMLEELDKLAVLVDADIFSLLSYHEAHSMAINEALFCGIPVVVTKTCNFDEVETAGAGFVVESNPKQLTGAILTLLQNPELRKKMGARGRQFILEKYSSDKTTDQVVEMYKRCLEKRSKNV